ncbi:hypothetical protein ACT91Q_20990 [Brevibacillus thermoruber]|uniref:hypothetical protein n=1 Tax=Brevibacillus thermoruber TaxID=33942 RepID=UPI004042BC2F
MKTFKSSIHLQLDLQNPNLVDYYILTPSHSQIFRGIIEGLQTENGMHSHFVIGPYGTGKSLLSVLLINWLVGRLSNENSNRLIEQAQSIDPELCQWLKTKTKVRYIPVILSGNRGNFKQAILSAIMKALREHQIEINVFSEVKTIQHVIQKWEKEFPVTYNRFCQYVSSLGYSVNDWLYAIQRYDEKLIEDFKVIYSELSAGAVFVSDFDGPMVEHLQHLLDELRDRGLGLFIVYDEFGRLLQSISNSRVLDTMQDLQEMAELANSRDNFHVVFIGHKNIRYYSLAHSEWIQAEFEKVEKRFRIYPVETDSATFLRLAQQAIATINKEDVDTAIVEEIVRNTLQYSLFPEMSPYQVEQHVIYNMYPLHPVSVFLLPLLSHVLGQNERTMFSFFESRDPYSLLHHINTDQGYYFADKLFLYFFQGESGGPIPEVALYNKLVSVTSDTNKVMHRILKLMTLWNIVNARSKQSLTTEFMAYALGIESSEMEKVLEEMVRVKVVRFNKILGQWELVEGSSLDLESLINQRIQTCAMSNKRKGEILEHVLENRYVLAQEYNDEKSMTRYARVCWIWATELLNGSIKQDCQKNADGYIYYILLDHLEQKEAVQEKLKDSTTMPLKGIFCVPNFTVRDIEQFLYRYEALEKMLQDPSLSAEDNRVRSELTHLMQETVHFIRKFSRRYQQFDEALRWWKNQDEIYVHSQAHLEHFVSELMFELYPDTPEIRNESFNRNHITHVQKRAAIDVVNRLISLPYEPNLAIEGFGPNYLIYTSVLKNHGYKVSTDGNIEFTSLSLEKLRNSLIQYLKQNPKGGLSEVVQLFSDSPYGIRKPIIPLLCVALLRDYWDQLIFYSYGMHVPHLRGEVIFEMFERAEDYEYIFIEIRPEHRSVLESVGHLFEIDKESIHLTVVAEIMVKWLRSLPKFTQVSNQMSEDAIQFKSIIRAGEIDPFRLIEQLMDLQDRLDAIKSEIETFMETNRLELTQTLLEMTGFQSFETLLEAIGKTAIDSVEMNSKLVTLSIERAKERGIDEIAEHLVGVHRSEWSDTTQSMFLKQFKHEWELLTIQTGQAENEYLLEQAAAYIGTMPPMELSKKSQLLYANIKNMLKYAGRDITEQELKYLLWKLLQEI